MNVGEICNREVIVAERTTSISDAAKLMREYHVGDLIVTEGKGKARIPVGIVTDRDLVIEILAKDIAAEQLTVGDVMSEDILVTNEEEDTDKAMEKMRNRGVRRLPIINKKGILVGIVTIDDLLDIITERMHNLVRLIAREQNREPIMRPGDK